MRASTTLARVALAVMGICVACSSSSPALTVGKATVDATHSCPAGAADAAYLVRATADLHNPTSSTVTIKSVTAQMKLEALKGTWAEKVGSTYDAGSVTFTPSSVPAGGSATLAVVIPSTCTNGKATGGSSYGDYLVTLHIVTSEGTFTAASGNMHRIVAA